MKTETKSWKEILKDWAGIFDNYEALDTTNLSDIGNEEIDEENKKILLAAHKSVDEKGKEVEKYIVAGERIKKDMSKVKHVINQKTEAAMRKYHNEIVEKEEERDR